MTTLRRSDAEDRWLDFPRSVPTPGVQYVKSLGGSVWLGAVVIVAERGVADFDLCSFESHVPR